MTFPTISKDFGPTSQGVSGTTEASLTQSREIGDVIPNPHLHEASIAKQEAPEAKPWAHFVAGG